MQLTVDGKPQTLSRNSLQEAMFRLGRGCINVRLEQRNGEYLQAVWNNTTGVELQYKSGNQLFTDAKPLIQRENAYVVLNRYTEGSHLQSTSVSWRNASQRNLRYWLRLAIIGSRWVGLLGFFILLAFLFGYVGALILGQSEVWMRAGNAIVGTGVLLLGLGVFGNTLTPFLYRKGEDQLMQFRLSILPWIGVALMIAGLGFAVL